MLVYLPLLFALSLLFLFVLVPYSARLDRAVTRPAFALFGGMDVEVDPQRERLLRTAAIGTPYREYATKTRLYVVGSGVATGVIGAYLGPSRPSATASAPRSSSDSSGVSRASSAARRRTCSDGTCRRCGRTPAGAGSTPGCPGWWRSSTR
ncbi:hypothetical protein BRD07_08525 [Halobacteriales archaeon QS_9_68_42]|nr:MAG: hypothetical protein BRD07_08525 [Halobacteriales archaeon QS_9_68_42]